MRIFYSKQTKLFLIGFLRIALLLPCSSAQAAFLFATSATSTPTLQPAAATIAQKASLSDYSEAAGALFGNIISPAAMLTGGLVPLGFAVDPPKKGKLRSLYLFLAVMSISNELLSIMYATVASNKLIETPTTPTSSVFALIQRDYELPWVGANIHFMTGLLGFVAMLMIRAISLFPSTVNKTAAGYAGAALLGMMSIVNVGVSAGDGRGRQIGGNVISLSFRYAILVLRHCLWKEKRPMAILAMVVASISLIWAVKDLLLSKAATE